MFECWHNKCSPISSSLLYFYFIFLLTRQHMCARCHTAALTKTRKSPPRKELKHWNGAVVFAHGTCETNSHIASVGNPLSSRLKDLGRLGAMTLTDEEAAASRFNAPRQSRAIQFSLQWWLSGKLIYRSFAKWPQKITEKNFLHHLDNPANLYANSRTGEFAAELGCNTPRFEWNCRRQCFPLRFRLVFTF